jgi:hypothetical protein
MSLVCVYELSLINWSVTSNLQESLINVEGITYTFEGVRPAKVTNLLEGLN